jgi:hypothetical protein
VTAANNGEYGLYALSARAGQFDHVLASGHADAGIYIGRCDPCDALVIDAMARDNSIGFEGTNASRVTIADSHFPGNRIGITANSQDAGSGKPSQDVVIAGNVVANNDNPRTPATAGAFGLGIALGGTVRARVFRNRVTHNAGVGVLVTTSDAYAPHDNRVDANVATGNGIDLALFEAGGGTIDARGNCFEANVFSSSFPAAIERALGCASASARVAGTPREIVAPPGISYRRVPPPPPQDSMPASGTAQAQPAVGLPPAISVRDIEVPAATASRALESR